MVSAITVSHKLSKTIESRCHSGIAYRHLSQ